jgi:hypothetical protein
MSALDVQARQHTLEPARATEQQRDGGHEHYPHERRVEDRRREADPEPLEEHARSGEERKEDDDHDRPPPR